jgi:hypothetical protein
VCRSKLGRLLDDGCAHVRENELLGAGRSHRCDPRPRGRPPAVA